MDSPYISAPSSPPNHFTDKSPFFEFNHHRHVSAPNSPTSSAAIYAAFRKIAAATRAAAGSHLSVPFDWEEKPGTPKSTSFDEKDDDFDFDFALGFSGGNADKIAQPPPESPGKEASMVSADELFEYGKIRPLKLPPRLCAPVLGEQGTKSPKSGGFLSPLRRGRNQRGKDLDPFVLAMVEATKSRRESITISPFECREKVGSSLLPHNPPSMAEKAGRGWKSRLKELVLFWSSSEAGVSRERKSNDFSKYGSSSSSSSNSSVGSGKVKTGFGVVAGAGAGGGCVESSCASFGSEQNGSKRRVAVVMEKKTATPYIQRMFIVRSIKAGKFGLSFIRRQT